MAITKKGLHLKSGQVLIAEDNYVVIQLTKPYLTTPEVTVHGQYGAINPLWKRYISYIHILKN